MSTKVIYADPAGNITAIIRTDADDSVKLQLTQEILQAKKAEQTGYECPPVNGGHCRLEMMGGEFCGNATRSMGYLYALEHYTSGKHQILVEISGAQYPVPVDVDLDAHTAYAQMPLPLHILQIHIDHQSYPLVVMEGISHLIAEKKSPSGDFVKKALAAADSCYADGCGIIFLSETDLVPAVYVRTTNSLVWESSCGSGSVAAAWYLTNQNQNTNQLPVKETFTYRFTEPGGQLEVSCTVQNGTITHCRMGGPVSIY